MSNMTNWRHYLDEDYEDEYQKIEKIPHRPKRTDEDKTKVSKKEKPRPQPEK